LEQLTRAQQRVRIHSSGKNLSMEVAFVGALISESLVKTLCAFQQKFPEVAMTLHDCTPSDQLKSLAERNIDLGFIGPAPKEIPKGVQVRNWRAEPLCVIVPKDHELAGNTTVRLDQLAGHSLSTVSHEAAPAYHTWLQDRFIENDTRPLIVQRADRAQAVCTMAAVSGYIALLTQSACMDLEGTAILPVTDKKGATLEMTHVAAFRPCGPEIVGKLIDFVSMGPV
jgi:DNA-binding transcriptional LysR family regulator